jgi:hypothetical protein
MGGELRAIDYDRNTPAVGFFDDPFDVGHPACDVGSSCRRQQAGRWGLVKLCSDVIYFEGAVCRTLDKAARGRSRPGQQIGMVFDDRRYDNIRSLEAKTIGKMVQRLGGVATQDRHVISA